MKKEQKTLFQKLISGAEFSECRKYRFALWRVWDESKPLVMFIGLNPSTANETEPDNTIKKVMKIANTNGFGGIYMMNCFAFVSRDPEAIEYLIDNPSDYDDDRDLENLQWLFDTARKCAEIVFAWGNFKVAANRGKHLSDRYPNAKALHINKNGSPKHPIYCKDDTKLISFLPNR